MTARLSQTHDEQRILQAERDVPGIAVAWGRAALKWARQKPLGALALLLLVTLVTIAVFAPVLAPFDVKATHPYSRLKPPSSTYLMGTDKLGRDVFSRVLYGARTDLVIAILSTTLGMGAATVVGLLTGYLAGGFLDHLLQRLIDIQMTIPALVLAIAIITGVGKGTTSLIVVTALILVPTSARVLRAAALAERGRQYVEAARTLGGTDVRIMFRHLLPNLVGSLIVLLTASLGATLLIEGGLSFLGYGPPPPTPTLGTMLSGENRDVLKSAVWLSIFPGLVFALAVFSINMLGDAVRDTLDPRLRGGTGRAQ
jgi:peptide/nickel transport system permease protein